MIGIYISNKINLTQRNCMFMVRTLQDIMGAMPEDTIYTNDSNLVNVVSDIADDMDIDLHIFTNTINVEHLKCSEITRSRMILNMDSDKLVECSVIYAFAHSSAYEDTRMAHIFENVNENTQIILETLSDGGSEPILIQGGKVQ